MRTFERGQQVKARAYDGEKLTRLVVADYGRSVVVCTKQEFEAAEREAREPEGVGFPKDDVSAT
jgi:hypothetical protein